MLVVDKTFTRVTFIDHAQQFIHQKRDKINHTCKLINAYNIINSCQQNEPVENWDRVKYHQINTHPKKGTITSSYERSP